MKCLKFNLLLSAVMFPMVVSASSEALSDKQDFKGNHYPKLTVNSDNKYHRNHSYDIYEQLNQLIMEKKKAKIESEINTKFNKYFLEF